MSETSWKLSPSHWQGFFQSRLQRLQNSPIGYRLARGAFWSAAGSVISRALGMASSIVVARLLGKSIFGELGVIQSTVGMFGTFAGFGMGLTAAKHVAEFRVGDPAKAGRVIGLSNLVAWVSSLIMATALLLLAPWLCKKILAAPQLTDLLRIGSLMLLFSAVNGALTGTLSGFEAFSSIARLNVISAILTILGSILGALYFGLWGLVVGLAGVQGVTFVVTYYAVRRQAAIHKVPISLASCLDELPIAWNFSVPALLSVIVHSPVSWACIAMLVNTPGGYGQMGIYSAANKWRAILFFLPTVLMQAVLPIMSSARTADGDSADFQTTFRFTQSVMVIIGFPACTLVMVAAHWIMPIYGRGFSMGAEALVFAALTTLVQCIGAAAGPAIESKGKMWMACAINSSYGCFLLVGALVLLPVAGAAGLLLASALSYVAVTVWAFTYLREELPSGMYRRIIAAMCFALVLGALCTLIPQRLSLALGAPLVALVAVVSFKYLTEIKTQRAILSFMLGRPSENCAA